MGSRVSQCCNKVSGRGTSLRDAEPVSVVIRNISGDVVFGPTLTSNYASVEELQNLVAHAMKGPGVKLLYKEEVLLPQAGLQSIGLVDGSVLTAVVSAPTWDLNLRNASARGADRVVEWLIDKEGTSVGVNETDEGGWTPLMFASDQGHEKIVDRLLDIAADVNAESRSGRTAVKLACRGGHRSVVEKLINAKADVSGTLHYGTESIWYPDLETVLTNAGASI